MEILHQSGASPPYPKKAKDENLGIQTMAHRAGRTD